MRLIRPTEELLAWDRDWIAAHYAALETLAHISALRGDRDVFEARAMRADWTDWMTGASTAVHAQILQFRGMSWRALGETTQARLWLEKIGRAHV